MALEGKMPPDPFGTGEAPDLTGWGANCRAMFVALVAAGFREDQALQVTVGCMAAMLTAARR